VWRKAWKSRKRPAEVLVLEKVRSLALGPNQRCLSIAEPSSTRSVQIRLDLFAECCRGGTLNATASSPLLAK